MVLQKIGRMEACSPRKNPLPAGEANLPLHRRRPFSALEPADFLTAIQNAESRGAIVTAHRLAQLCWSGLALCTSCGPYPLRCGGGTGRSPYPDTVLLNYRWCVKSPRHKHAGGFIQSKYAGLTSGGRRAFWARPCSRAGCGRQLLCRQGQRWR